MCVCVCVQVSAEIAAGGTSCSEADWTILKGRFF